MSKKDEDKGIWLPKTKAIAVMGSNVPKFERERVDYIQRDRGKKHEYFIPASKMSKNWREYYTGQFISPEEDDEPLEDILGEVGDINSSNVENELLQARLANLAARTEVLKEKLSSHKEDLFNEWSDKVFTLFTNAFARFKNSLISLHLNEEQLSTLKRQLDDALVILDNGLQDINSAYMNEDKDEENSK